MRASAANDRKMPIHSKVQSFWERSDELHERGIEIVTGETACFACGQHRGLQRCHIQPKRDGGSDDVSNIHLLCPNCHIESEDYHGPDYWEWLRARNQSWGFQTPIERAFKRALAMPQIVAKELAEMCAGGEISEPDLRDFKKTDFGRMIFPPSE